jgi:hypothetical protein
MEETKLKTVVDRTNSEYNILKKSLMVGGWKEKEEQSQD